MNIAFVTNLCAHYRVKTFEILSEKHNVTYYFFSAGDEWYWQQQHGVNGGRFKHKYLSGFRIGRTRYNLTLPLHLWKENCDVFVKCINGKFALPITYLIARMRGKPFILWTGVWMRLDTTMHRAFFPVVKYIYRHSDAIVVYGNHVKDYLVSEGVPAERIFVAAHAVENDAYNRAIPADEKVYLREKLGILAEQKVVLYLGRLEDGKGLPYLLKAFALLERDDVMLVMAGAGSEGTRLEQLAQEEGIADRVRFPGYVPTEEAVLYYSIAWVYVLPSVTTPVFKEPWGLVVNEAFNQGLPVIATDAVGAAAGGLLQDGVNGFMVPERNSVALTQAMQKLLNNPDIRENMSQNALSIIADWDNERMVEGFQQAIAYVTDLAI